jgi:uncharacterized protein YijF (DUF1287 family)
MQKVIFFCVFALSLSLSAETTANSFTKKLVAAADDRPNHEARYEQTYVKIPYPNGDVPADTGNNADEIIRIYRAVGIDLQKEVHEDMKANRAAYPFPSDPFDTNIDHRRVPNLAVFFSRKGKSLPVTENVTDYLPGDIVTWRLPNGTDHIGMVVDKKTASGAYMVEHNVGDGPQIEDVLLEWDLTGHYRYEPVRQRHP